MAPEDELKGALVLRIVEGLAPDAAPANVAVALRRAVMARVQEKIGATHLLPPFFTGHALDGAPLRDGGHAHLAFAFDPAGQRLLIIAPHRIEGREATRDEERHWVTLDAALAEFRDLRAGSTGRLRLAAAESLPAMDTLVAVACQWTSVTPFIPTRYAKGLAPERIIEDDILRECHRRRWPKPKVQELSVREGQRGGLAAMVRLEFAVARAGPILLGRTAHQGGGLFQALV